MLVDQPTPFELARVPGDRELWINTRDTINKASTSATVVLVGRVPGDPDSLATMWVIPGEPVTAVAVPLWVEAGASPPELWQGNEAPLWAASAAFLLVTVLAFVRTLQKHYILAVPGSGFGRGGHIRLSFCVTKKEIEGALPGIKKAVEDNYNVTVEAVNTLIMPAKEKTRMTRSGMLSATTP